MNETANKLLLEGDRIVPDMHLREPRFTYNACGHFIKNKKRIQKLKKQEIQCIIIKTNWAKLAFNMIWLMEIFTIYQEEQLLKNYYVTKHLILLKMQKRIENKEVLLQWFINFFDKRSSATHNGTEINYQLAQELHKPITLKFEKRKVYSSFKGYLRYKTILCHNAALDV